MSILARWFYRRMRPELAVAAGLCVGSGVTAATLARLADSAIRGGPEGGDSGLGTLLQLIPYARDVLIAAPIISGVVVATSLVAREFEQRTIGFAWSACPDRRRWLADSYLAGIFVVTVLALALALAEIAISQALGPQQDSVWSPRPLESAPLVVLLSSWVAFGVTGVVGLAMGRSLPTLLAGLMASCLLIGLFETASWSWTEANAVIIDSSTQGSLYIRSAYVDSQGTFLTPDEAVRAAAIPGRAPEEIFTAVDLGLPTSQRMLMVGGEAVVEIAITASTVAAALIIADRRRLG